MSKPTRTFQIALKSITEAQETNGFLCYKWKLIFGFYYKLLLILPMLIVGCSGSQIEDTSDLPRGLEAKEAPMWAKQVADGKTPSALRTAPRKSTRR